MRTQSKLSTDFIFNTDYRDRKIDFKNFPQQKSNYQYIIESTGAKLTVGSGLILEGTKVVILGSYLQELSIGFHNAVFYVDLDGKTIALFNDSIKITKDETGYSSPSDITFNFIQNEIEVPVNVTVTENIIKNFVVEFDSLSSTQREMIRGPKGLDSTVPGPKSTTPGPKGLDSKVPGPRGNPFVYQDFTQEQLLALKGNSFVYSDFTPSQLADLKGKDGAPFTYNMFTPTQLEGLRGNTGAPFTYSMFTENQLEDLKGDKGDDFKYSDFTPAQLLALKGDKGDAFEYEDFTPSQLALLKGADGKSAYQVWLDNGNTGSVTVFLDSLKGKSVEVILATNQANAVTLSTANPNNIYYWI